MDEIASLEPHFTLSSPTYGTVEQSKHLSTNTTCPWQITLEHLLSWRRENRIDVLIPAVYINNRILSVKAAPEGLQAAPEFYPPPYSPETKQERPRPPCCRFASDLRCYCWLRLAKLSFLSLVLRAACRFSSLFSETAGPARTGRGVPV